MEWAVKLLFKLILLVVAIGIVFSFVRQLFSQVQRPVVMAGPGSGRLPVPMPKAGIVPASRHSQNEVSVPAPLPPGAHQHSIAPAAPESPRSMDTSKPIVEAFHDQILYRFIEANAQGNRLTIRLEALNRGVDRMIEISSLPWSKTLFYNERGEAYPPEEVRIANARANAGKTRAMLVSGVPAEVLLGYSDLPMTAGNLAFRQVALMQLDVALFSTDQAYRNFFAEPIAVSRPTFRLLAIADGSSPSEAPR